MSNKNFPCLQARFFDVFLSGIIPSLAAMIVIVKLLKAYDYVLAIDVALNIFYLAWSAYCLFRYRVYVKGKKRYFRTNLLVVSCYGLLGTGCAFLLRFLSKTPYFDFFNKLYTYLFFNFKVFHFMGNSGGFNIGITDSALIFTAIHLLVVVIVPFTFDKKKYIAYIKRKKKTIKRNIFT